ncbi:MAG: TolC family protein [Candidatus Latescibacteria bacterium]|jgi:outer membrane protein|nr:TolC family protein [Candidatus Latescibacterota bacterium]
MIHIKLYFFTAIFGIFILMPIAMGYSEEKHIELSLRDCIDRALKENLNFKSAALGLKMNELSVVQQESIFDPGISLQVGRSETNRPNFASYIPVNSIESETTNLNLQYGQKLWTGADWGAGFTSILSESNIETEKNYLSYFGINFTQPLLKGFGKKVNESGIYTARLNGQITELEIEDNAASLVYEVESIYWNLIYARETLKVLELAVDQADSLLAYNSTACELGLRTESDVLEAKSALINREQDVLDQEKLVCDLEDKLKRLLNISTGTDGPVRVIPTDSPEVIQVELDWEQILNDALRYHPDYQASKTAVEKNELQAAVAKNSLLPDLNLITSYKINGSGETVGDNFSDIGSGDTYGWEVSLNLSFPVGSNYAEAAYEKSKIDVKRSQLSVEDLEQRISTEIQTAIRNVEVNREKVDVMTLSVEINELKLEKEEERYRNNLSTSFFVLEYQKDLMNARNLYNKALMDYTMAVEELKLISGTLLKDINISIIGIKS